MESPPIPLVAYFFIENFERGTLQEMATLKPQALFRYVNNTFVIRKHG